MIKLGKVYRTDIRGNISYSDPNGVGLELEGEENLIKDNLFVTPSTRISLFTRIRILFKAKTFDDLRCILRRGI